MFSDRRSSLVFQHRLYLKSIFLASKWSWIWYGWDDLHDLITYSLNILCMESVFSSMMNRGWIWTWFWSKEKSFIWCLTMCYNTFYIFGKCGSAWLIRFDLRELELIAWAVIFIRWLFYVWHDILVIKLRDWIRSTTLKICLGVLEGVTTRQVETPCLGVRNTRSGLWKRKVSWRLIDQAYGDYLYSSCTIIVDILSLWRNISCSNEDYYIHLIR